MEGEVVERTTPEPIAAEAGCRQAVNGDAVCHLPGRQMPDAVIVELPACQAVYVKALPGECECQAGCHAAGRRLVWIQIAVRQNDFHLSVAHGSLNEASGRRANNCRRWWGSDDFVPESRAAWRVSRSSNLKFSPDAIVGRAHWPNKEGKGGIETLPNGTVPSTGRRRWQVGTQFAGGRTVRMEDLDPLADRICRSALSLFASLLLSIKGYILNSISEPAA
jgi:hypothetical protein